MEARIRKLIPPVLRICQRCAYLEDEYCTNDHSPHANKNCGYGWTCDYWKPNEETTRGLSE